MEQEQLLLDRITSESSKLQKLKESYIFEEKTGEKKKMSDDAEEQLAETEKKRSQELESHIRIQLEAQQSRSLLQAVISESKASGFPMPPSLIKLLNSTNGNYDLSITLKIPIAKYVHFVNNPFKSNYTINRFIGKSVNQNTFVFSVSVSTLKQRVKVAVDNTEIIKQDTSETKTRVKSIHEEIAIFNNNVKSLTNHVKVCY